MEIKKIWKAILPALIYLLLAILLTWPTITHLTTHLPGDGGDDPAIAWNLWWVKYALLNRGQNPFQTDFMAYPIGLNLAFYTLTLLNALTALPLTLNFGVVAASNLHLLFTFVMSGYGMTLLTRYLTPHSSSRNPHPSIIAGIFYAFASSKLFYVALGQFNIASTHWIPFALLYFLRTQQQPYRLKNPLMTALFLTMQAYTEMTYASFLLVFMGLYFGFWILDFRFWSGIQNLKSKIQNPSNLILLFTFAIGLSPMLAQMLPDMQREGDFFVEGSGFAEAFSADVLGFIVPTMHHPFLGKLIQQTNITHFDKGQHIYLGFVLLGLTLVARLRIGEIANRRMGDSHTRTLAISPNFWLFASLIFALLCLGPTIIINGYDTHLSGPFVIFQHLPFFKGNRYPSRYAVMLLLTLSVTATFSLNALRLTSTKRLNVIIPYALLLLFLFEHLAVPLPQSDMRPPTAYQIIATDPADVTVLDIPFAWRNGFRITGALTTQFMLGQFYQTVHQKRLLQSNTSRNPAFKFQYFTEAPIINSLLALETGKTLPAEQWEHDRKIANEISCFFNIKYIVVRPDETGNPQVTPQATLAYIETILPFEKIHDETAIKIYRLKHMACQSFPHLLSGAESTNLVNSPLSPLIFAEGWGKLTTRTIAAQRQTVRLFVKRCGCYCLCANKRNKLSWE